MLPLKMARVPSWTGNPTFYSFHDGLFLSSFFGAGGVFSPMVKVHYLVRCCDPGLMEGLVHEGVLGLQCLLFAGAV